MITGGMKRIHKAKEKPSMFYEAPGVLIGVIERLLHISGTMLKLR